MLKTDVLIVGAGPVGLLSALALGQRGVEVIVIEADDRLNESPQAAIYFPCDCCRRWRSRESNRLRRD